MGTVDTGVILAALGAVGSAIVVMARYFVKSIVSEQVERLKDHVDRVMEKHIRNDHGYYGGGYQNRSGGRYRPSYKPEEPK